jgi:hypothetical protein
MLRKKRKGYPKNKNEEESVCVQSTTTFQP